MLKKKKEKKERNGRKEGQTVAAHCSKYLPSSPLVLSSASEDFSLQASESQ